MDKGSLAKIHYKQKVSLFAALMYDIIHKRKKKKKRKETKIE